MSRRVISQREARRLQKRVSELEQAEFLRTRTWASEYPGGVNIDTINVNATEWAICNTARRLGHAVVVLCDKENYLRLMAVKVVKP